ncbi:hypothetical protein PoB_002281300 [Plakobranchus ocellatus]|uniref:Uncharacterized protein n=1 Tax=Plakobranchus ocellatus TaxID=259542 RepID=A0AAV3ZPA9_9GAST|nr:hypothetical protein PoB_002281300 [Plakobranchus ocellatus]
MHSILLQTFNFSRLLSNLQVKKNALLACKYVKPSYRREKLENLVTTGMLEGKRSRGKQREKLIEGLADWLKAGKSLEAIEATKDRKKWRTMIANAVKQGT